MKILCISTYINSDFMKRLADDGHEVKCFISKESIHSELKENSYDEDILKRCGAERINSFYHLVEDTDMIIFSDTNLGDDIDFLREKGYKVFGVGKEGEQLENNRMFAKRICKKYGLKVPETKEMLITKAIDFVKEEGNKEGYAIRFSTVRTDLLSTYIPVSKDDCLWYLSKVADVDRGAQVILEGVIDGVEAAISGYFDGEKFLKPFFINFKHKKLMDGEVGPKTGEMGIAIYATSEDLPFVNYFRQLEDYLKSIDYHGIIDADCIVNEDGYFVLKFTLRIGSLAFTTESFLHREGIADIVGKVIDGGSEKFDVEENTWAVGVCLNAAGYPYSEIVNKQGCIRLYGLDEAVKDGCKIGYEALTKREDKYYSSPSNGRVIVLVGTGNTIREAREDAYRGLDHISMSDMIYRLDIGMKVERKLENLVEWGVLPESILKGG